MRALSRATMGNTMAPAMTPSRPSACVMALAVLDSPHITGMMGVTESPVSKPMLWSSLRKYSVFSHNRAWCSGSLINTSMAAF